MVDNGKLEFIHITTRPGVDRHAQTGTKFLFVFAYRKNADGSFNPGPASRYVYAIPQASSAIPTVQNVKARSVGPNSVHLT